jgi:hypothetical protein
MAKTVPKKKITPKKTEKKKPVVQKSQKVDPHQ